MKLFLLNNIFNYKNYNDFPKKNSFPNSFHSFYKKKFYFLKENLINSQFLLKNNLIYNKKYCRFYIGFFNFPKRFLIFF